MITLVETILNNRLWCSQGGVQQILCLFIYAYWNTMATGTDWWAFDDSGWPDVFYWWKLANVYFNT